MISDTKNGTFELQIGIVEKVRKQGKFWPMVDYTYIATSGIVPPF